MNVAANGPEDTAPESNPNPTNKLGVKKERMIAIKYKGIKIIHNSKPGTITFNDINNKALPTPIDKAIKTGSLFNEPLVTSLIWSVKTWTDDSDKITTKPIINETAKVGIKPHSVIFFPQLLANGIKPIFALVKNNVKPRKTYNNPLKILITCLFFNFNIVNCKIKNKTAKGAKAINDSNK